MNEKHKRRSVSARLAVTYLFSMVLRQKLASLARPVTFPCLAAGSTRPRRRRSLEGQARRNRCGNFAGTALSVGLSNAYYPVHSRNLNATAINWGTSAAGTGFGNLFPEFLPDGKGWLKRHHL